MVRRSVVRTGRAILSDALQCRGYRSAGWPVQCRNHAQLTWDDQSFPPYCHDDHKCINCAVDDAETGFGENRVAGSPFRTATAPRGASGRGLHLVTRPPKTYRAALERFARDADTATCVLLLAARVHGAGGIIAKACALVVAVGKRIVTVQATSGLLIGVAVAPAPVIDRVAVLWLAKSRNQYYIPRITARDPECWDGSLI